MKPLNDHHDHEQTLEVSQLDNDLVFCDLSAIDERILTGRGFDENKEFLNESALNVSDLNFLKHFKDMSPKRKMMKVIDTTEEKEEKKGDEESRLDDSIRSSNFKG